MPGSLFICKTGPGLSSMGGGSNPQTVAPCDQIVCASHKSRPIRPARRWPRSGKGRLWPPDHYAAAPIILLCRSYKGLHGATLAAQRPIIYSLIESYRYTGNALMIGPIYQR